MRHGSVHASRAQATIGISAVPPSTNSTLGSNRKFVNRGARCAADATNDTAIGFVRPRGLRSDGANCSLVSKIIPFSILGDHLDVLLPDPLRRPGPFMYAQSAMNAYGS